MSTATALSRVTGFVRVWATAFALGASGLMSAYTVANNIPNMIYELVAGGIISSLFIPTFMEIRASRDSASAWRFASHVFNLSAIALGLLALVGTFFPEPFVYTQTFRMSAAEAATVREAATFFFRIFAIQVLFYGAGAVIQSLLNAQRKYLWPALGPVFNNVVVIITMFVFVAIGPNRTGLIVLAAGTTLGVVAMFAVQIPTLVRTGLQYSPSLGLDDPALRRMLVLAVPTIVYVITNLVAVSFRNASAFAVSPKGPSILTYAWIFYQLPYGILAVALATAVFTELSEAAGTRDTAGFRFQFARGLRANGILMLPAAAMLVALATPLVSLFRAGAFKASDVAPVASALRWWGLGLVFYASTMFVLKAFYSLKDTQTPMIVNLITTVLVQISLYYVLSTGIGSWHGLGINGIPIADGVFYAVTVVVLTLLLRKRVGALELRGVAATYGRMLVASVVGAVVAWAVALVLQPVVSGFFGAVIQVAAGGSVGLLVAWGLGRALGVTEVTALTSMVGRTLGRFRRGRS